MHGARLLAAHRGHLFLTTLHTVLGTQIMAPLPDHIAHCTRYTNHGPPAPTVLRARGLHWHRTLGDDGGQRVGDYYGGPRTGWGEQRSRSGAVRQVPRSCCFYQSGGGKVDTGVSVAQVLNLIALRH
jgi:hypothetical protein